LEQAVEVARELAPWQTYFTHMSHELEHEATNASLPAGMALAYDGLRIELT
jgi:phosphoribosyl 1,2-cyclic phosphate phosphodiesterase